MSRSQAGSGFPEPHCMPGEPGAAPESAVDDKALDTAAPLISLDYTPKLVADLMGERGLVVVGMGRAAERGFQMLYRFAGACGNLETLGVNVAFVYPKESARHVFDATSIRAARYRAKPVLFLDASGKFFRAPLEARSLRVVHLDRELQETRAAHVALTDADWDARLLAFFAGVSGKGAVEG